MTRPVTIRGETVGTSVAPIFTAPLPATIEAGQTVATLIASLDAPTISEAGVPAIDGGDLTSTITVGGDSVSGDYELAEGDVVRRVVSVTHATGVVVVQSAPVTVLPALAGEVPGQMAPPTLTYGS